MKPPPGYTKKVVTSSNSNVALLDSEQPSMAISKVPEPPAGFKKVKSVPSTPEKDVAGLYSKSQLAEKMIPQFTKGLYDAFQPVSGKIINSLPNASIVNEVQANTPAPRGFLPMLARVAGEIAPSIPFEKGAGALLPKASPLVKASLGWGAYKGTQSALEGNNPNDVAKTTVGNTALAYGGGKALGLAYKGASKGGGAIVKGGSDLVKRMTGRLSESELGKYVQGVIEKAIRPTVVGKNSAGQYQTYMKKAKDAVEAIVKHKDALNIKNEYGEVTGKLPSNLDQFSQAIDQVKTKLFSTYNALAERTGEAGITIDATPVAKEIREQVNNKAVRTFFPEIHQHAMELADKLEADGIFSPQEVQQAIELLNGTLNAYYRNPNPQAASKVVLDVAITTKLRKLLDQAIEGLTGSSYQELKNQYGALRSIQDEVIKRAIVDARKNTKGFFDLTDVFSTGDIAQGLLSLNPSQIGRGGAMRLAKNAIKFLNDPNRMVKEMFQTVDKVRSRTGFPKSAVSDIVDAEFTVLPKAKQLTGKVGSSLSLPGPKTPKLLGVSTQFGDGFERVSYPEAVKRIKDFAFRYYNPQKKMIEIPEGTVMGTKAKGILKKMGIDPITGKMKYGKVPTAFEMAWKRSKKIVPGAGIVAGATYLNSSSAEASMVPFESMTKQFEGFRPNVYLIGGKRHIGYGFNLEAHPEIKVGKNGMSKDQAEPIFQKLYEKAKTVAQDYVGLETYQNLSPSRQAVLNDMAYNLEGKLRDFKKMKSAIISGDYKKASQEMVNSPWYRQVKIRGKKLVEMMKNG